MRASRATTSSRLTPFRPSGRRALPASRRSDGVPMKLQFDANQTYQLQAIAAVTDLFEGQPQGPPEYAVIDMGEWGGMFAGQQQTELGVGNGMLLSTDRLL